MALTWCKYNSLPLESPFTLWEWSRVVLVQMRVRPKMMQYIGTERNYLTKLNLSPPIYLSWEHHIQTTPNLDHHPQKLRGTAISQAIWVTMWIFHHLGKPHLMWTGLFHRMPLCQFCSAGLDKIICDWLLVEFRWAFHGPLFSQVPSPKPGISQ